jgi:hypothetical protein
MVKQLHKNQLELDLTASNSSLLKDVETLLIESEEDTKRALFNDDYSSEFSKYDSEEEAKFKSKLQLLGIDVASVYHYGGEGEGEEYHTVWKFSRDKEEVYFKFDGYYQSYDGATYHEYFQVEPKEVKVIRYGPVIKY